MIKTQPVLYDTVRLCSIGDVTEINMTCRDGFFQRLPVQYLNSYSHQRIFKYLGSNLKSKIRIQIRKLSLHNDINKNNRFSGSLIGYYIL